MVNMTSGQEMEMTLFTFQKTGGMAMAGEVEVTILSISLKLSEMENITEALEMIVL